LNVIIGPNGSGKSNLLDGFYLLSQLAHGDAFQTALRGFGGPKELRWKGADTSTIEVELSGEQERRFCYSVTWVPPQGNVPHSTILDESFVELETACGRATTYFRTHGDQVELADDRGDSSSPDLCQTELVKRGFFKNTASLMNQNYIDPSTRRAFICFRVDWLVRQLKGIAEFRDWSFGRASAPRRAHATNMPTDGLLPNGSNLAMMLQELAYRGRLDDLNAKLRRLMPRTERLTTRISGGTILPYLHEEGVSDPVSATRLSDGTLRFIGLLVTLLSEPHPPLICIEEPELGLHPDALSIVAELLVEASKTTQIVVTTHSEALLSAINDPDSVLVCDYVGGTRLRRLDANDLNDWLNDYRLGDLWRIGHLGGNP